MKISYIIACLSVGVIVNGAVSINSFAQVDHVAAPASTVKQSANSGYNTILTKIDDQGYIFNNNDVCIGKIDKKGAIYNGNNTNLGKIYKNGYLYNAKNDNVGKVDKKGNIYNPYSVNIGKVNKDGEVYNSNNIKIGQVSKKYKTASLLLLLKDNNLFNQN